MEVKKTTTEKKKENKSPKFFHFRQNNSGGSFVTNENLDQNVIIEAYNYEQANYIGESLGMYFDGAGDCNCCGNRWSDQYSNKEGTDKPSIYAQSIDEFIKNEYFSTTIIHYLDGKIENFKYHTKTF